MVEMKLKYALKRQTGRTTRMVYDIVDKIRRGDVNILVVGHSKPFLEELNRLIDIEIKANIEQKGSFDKEPNIMFVLYENLIMGELMVTGGLINHIFYDNTVVDCNVHLESILKDIAECGELTNEGMVVQVGNGRLRIELEGQPFRHIVNHFELPTVYDWDMYSNPDNILSSIRTYRDITRLIDLLKNKTVVTSTENIFRTSDGIDNKIREDVNSGKVKLLIKNNSSFDYYQPVDFIYDKESINCDGDFKVRLHGTNTNAFFGKENYTIAFFGKENYARCILISK